MKNLTILKRVIILCIVLFLFCTSVGAYVLNNKLSDVFTQQYLNSQTVITKNLSEEIVNGVRFNKSEMVTDAFDKLQGIHSGFINALVLNVKDEVLVNNIKGDLNSNEGVSQLLENASMQYIIVDNALFQKVPVTHTKTDSQVGWLIVQWDLSVLPQSLA